MAKTIEEFMAYRREICKKSQAKRRAYAKMYGMCRQCIKRKAMPQRTLCPACLLKQREAQMRYSKRQPKGTDKGD